MAVANKEDVGLQEGLSRRPPSHVPNVETISGDAKVMNQRHRHVHRRSHSNQPIERRPQRQQRQHSKGSQRGHQITKIPYYPPSRVSGMQAVFLDTWQKSTGTGVFFPQNAGKNSGCHVALVPLRVIEALNVNGHALGPKIGDQQQDEEFKAKDNQGNEKSTQQRCSLSQNENASPEIFLPKEWTY